MSRQRCIDLLTPLIAHRTTNPRGDEHALCAFLGDRLRERGADTVEVAGAKRANGEDGAYVFARYGEPRWLINVHVDTVPVNAGWTRDPFTAEISDDKLYGLGSADTKGAIAAILTAIDEVKPKHLALLFSGDEENGTGVMRAFFETELAAGIERALVCEPTTRVAGVRHRGISGYRAEFTGRGGHSSRADHQPKPIVTLARLAVELDAIAADYLDRGPDDMKGICMNVAGLDGGVAFNVIPERATLTWSLRPPPGFDADAFAARQDAAVAAVDPSIRLQRVVRHHPFATREVRPFEQLLGDAPASFGPLQFWTEAAVLSDQGIDAVVIGPGDIAQAHAADEYVTLADLDWAVALFRGVIQRLNDAAS